MQSLSCTCPFEQVNKDTRGEDEIWPILIPMILVYSTVNWIIWTSCGSNHSHQENWTRIPKCLPLHQATPYSFHPPVNQYIWCMRNVNSSGNRDFITVKFEISPNLNFWSNFFEWSLFISIFSHCERCHQLNFSRGLCEAMIKMR
jgi:hypothetical protein